MLCPCHQNRCQPLFYMLVCDRACNVLFDKVFIAFFVYIVYLCLLLLCYVSHFYTLYQSNLLETQNISLKLPLVCPPTLLKKIAAPEGGHFCIFRVFSCPSMYQSRKKHEGDLMERKSLSN